MIIGIGIDIVEVARMDTAEGFLSRILHPDEFAYVTSSGELTAVLAAARFAAKEALGKALGVGLRGFSLKDVRVVHRDGGKPDLVLEGKALELFRSSGGTRVHLSLSHERHYASAVVIIEGDHR